MDHRERIQRAVEFIERGLTSPLAMDDIARCACFSPFHFQRVFQTLVGHSVGEYIRGRRLCEAARDLVEDGQRILDIALKYRYETHESFTRAFKKHYGMTPKRFRAARVVVHPFGPARLLGRESSRTRGDTDMGARIVEKDAFTVIGACLRTTTRDSENVQAIPEFWGRFLRDGNADRIPNRTQPNTLLGMCADSADDGSFSYLICAEVSSCDDVPDGMVARTIPAARYVVFTAKGKVPESIQETWRHIFATGLSEAGVEHAGTEDFELYDERFDHSDRSEVDVYIPVK